MSKKSLSRSDRVAQLRIQEELIAKKRKEIFEKQKTSELGKAVAAAQNRLKKDESDSISLNPSTTNINKVVEPSKPTNNFCNDGSFFEHFKQIMTSNNIEISKTEKEDPTDIQIDQIKPEPDECEEDLQIHQNSNELNSSLDMNINSDEGNKDLSTINLSSTELDHLHMQTNSSPYLQGTNKFQSTAAQFNPNIPPPIITAVPAVTATLPSALNMFVPKQSSIMLDLPSEIHNVLPPPPPPPPESPTKNEMLQDVIEEKEHHKCVEPLNILPTSLESLIKLVVENGDAYEEYLQSRRHDLHSSMWFLFDMESDEYSIYRRRVTQTRRLNAIYKPELMEEKYDPESVCDNDSDDEYNRTILNRNTNNLKRRIETRVEFEEKERLAEEARQKKRKSRWGEKIEDDNSASTSINATVQASFGNQNKPILSTILRTDPALLQYARLNYGTTDLAEDVWIKCEEHFKINLLYQDMMKKRQEIDQLAKTGKFKYEYDSDEDIEGGTWEHKLRTAEMEATEAWADALTAQSEGKHHIGDFLPPEELKKFMEQYEAKKNNRLPDLSDYKEYKLKEDNKGFQMLQKLGWQQGQGLGADGDGIVEPVNKAIQRQGNQGLGVAAVANPENCDNEYEAYRKRMMLAYRFRPNPLNNPRRAYY